MSKTPPSAKCLACTAGQPPSEAILLGFMGVSAAHLAIAFAAIDTEAGSLEAYLTTLGVDAGLRQRLRARLLA